MHPPGVLNSHICGNILRIFRLNSDEIVITADVINISYRFLRLGRISDSLKLLFLNSISNAREFIVRSDGQHKSTKTATAEAVRRILYLHTEYHD